MGRHRRIYTEHWALSTKHSTHSYTSDRWRLTWWIASFLLYTQTLFILFYHLHLFSCIFSLPAIDGGCIYIYTVSLRREKKKHCAVAKICSIHKPVALVYTEATQYSFIHTVEGGEVVSVAHCKVHNIWNCIADTDSWLNSRQHSVFMFVSVCAQWVSINCFHDDGIRSM